jgi:hypothetical protein
LMHLECLLWQYYSEHGSIHMLTISIPKNELAPQQHNSTWISKRYWKNYNWLIILGRQSKSEIKTSHNCYNMPASGLIFECVHFPPTIPSYYWNKLIVRGDHILIRLRMERIASGRLQCQDTIQLHSIFPHPS